MFNWLLSTKPTFVAGGPEKWIQENINECLFIFFLGMIIGIGLSYVFYKIRIAIISKNNKKSDE